MLRYVLKFESVLFNFTIIYFTFLFSLGPLLLSPHLLFLPSICSFLHRIVYALSLSLHFFALSLYSTSLPPSPTKPRPEHQATPCHTNPTYTLRLPSTNTATRTRPTTSTTTYGLIITPRHATSPSMSCHPPRHRNFPPSDFSQLACSGGFCFWVCLIWDVGLFDLVVFFAVLISLVVFDVGFAFGFV